MKESCGTCRFGRPSTDDKWPDLVECRRRPPDQGGRPATAWPRVHPDGWCGEFESDRRETAAPKSEAVKRPAAGRETR